MTARILPAPFLLAPILLAPAALLMAAASPPQGPAAPPTAAPPTAEERLPAAARAVVERYYALLDARDYPAAFALWGENGPPGQSPRRFADGFRRTASTRVTAGAPVNGDAGMGQSYVTVPVTVDATLTDGTRQRFRGTYLVSRVNDVPGATPAQLRWHLRNARLRRVPAD